MKLGYFGNSEDYSHPADRRRFCHYAKKENLFFEHPNLRRRYDCIIFTIASNFHEVLKYKKKFPETTLIFDYCDDLLSDKPLKKLLRPMYEALKWKNLGNFTNYNKLVKKIIKDSDLVVCGSDEQRNNLLRLNKNIYVIPDFVITESFFYKNNYELVESPKVNILWEGLSGGFFKVKNNLIDLVKSLDQEVILNIVTDKDTYMIGDRYIKKNTQKIISKLSKKHKIKIRFWEWSKSNLNKAIERSDFGVIYIPGDDMTMQNKPENKLVLLSSFALPVLVSRTPSYERYLTSAGGEKFCSLVTEPHLHIRKFCKDVEFRKNVGNTIFKHANHYYSEEKICLEWKNLLTKGSLS